MAFRVQNNRGVEQRRPRQRDKPHLACVAKLPCVVCHRHPVEVAHVRFASVLYDKPETGMQRKPDDKWTAPLCSGDHRLGPNSQHSMDERIFWLKNRIDILALCTDLYEATGHIEEMTRIVMKAKWSQQGAQENETHT